MRYVAADELLVAARRWLPGADGVGLVASHWRILITWRKNATCVDAWSEHRWTRGLATSCRGSVPNPGARDPSQKMMWDDMATYATRQDRKSTRLNSSHVALSRMPSSA
jgi:hypothetical protein